MKIGGGVERFMIGLPLVVALVITMYFLGGPDRTMALMERMARDGWTLIENAIR